MVSRLHRNYGLWTRSGIYISEWHIHISQIHRYVVVLIIGEQYTRLLKLPGDPNRNWTQFTRTSGYTWIPILRENGPGIEQESFHLNPIKARTRAYPEPVKTQTLQESDPDEPGSWLCWQKPDPVSYPELVLNLKTGFCTYSYKF